jgi:EmrB/QacA subfamily drug resistance transporter
MQSTQIAAPTNAAPDAATAAIERRVLIVAILGSAMAFLDGTVVNVALPALQTAFHATGSQMQWIVESYALTLAALILAGGAMGDRLGRKRMFLLGVVMFVGASMWCGATTTIHGMIAARAIQGIGAALLIPGSLSIVTAVFPEERRGTAIGIWSGATALTAAAGPVMGGWLVEHVSWRGIFFLNLPFGVAILWLCARGVPETRQPDAKGLDWMGSVLASAGLGAATYALLEFPANGSRVLPIGIGGVVLLLLFLSLEARSENAMAPLELFRSRDFLGANLMTFFLYSALSALLYYMPLDLMQVQGYTPTAAGSAMLPVVVLIFLLSRWSGGLVDRYGAMLPLVAGPVLVALGFLMLTLPGIGGSYWVTYFPAGMMLGLGMAVSVAPLTTVVMNSVDETRAGAASGVNNAVSRVANLLALAVFGVILHGSFVRALNHQLQRPGISAQVRQTALDQRNSLAGIQTGDPAGQRAVALAFLTGFRHVMYVAAGLCVLAAVSAGALVHPNRKEV